MQTPTMSYLSRITRNLPATLARRMLSLSRRKLPNMLKDLLDAKHRIIVKPPKIVITPVKDPEDVCAPVEHETSDDKTDGEDVWMREMSLTEQPDEYDSDADQESVPPAVIYDTNCNYDEVEEVDAVISEEEVKLLLEEGLIEDKKDWKQAVEPRDESLPPC